MPVLKLAISEYLEEEKTYSQNAPFPNLKLTFFFSSSMTCLCCNRPMHLPQCRQAMTCVQGRGHLIQLTEHPSNSWLISTRFIPSSRLNQTLRTSIAILVPVCDPSTPGKASTKTLGTAQNRERYMTGSSYFRRTVLWPFFNTTFSTGKAIVWSVFRKSELILFCPCALT